MSEDTCEMKDWNGMKLVRISDVDGFAEWLDGQTLPLVEDDENPTDWAYYTDYFRYIQGYPCVD